MRLLFKTEHANESPLARELSVSRLKLYSGTRNASSWAMRAWLALREAEIPFDEEIIDIRRPQRFDNLARMARLTPSGTVPALETPGGMIFDSLAIMEYANDLADGRLMPRDQTVRARARSVLAWQHAGLSFICPAISFESAFYSHKRPLTVDEIASGRRFFQVVEDLCAAHGGSGLFGDVSLADLALVPAVVRLTRHRIDLAGLPRAQAWAEALLERPHVRDWMAEADSLDPIWFDDYLSPPPACVNPLPTLL